MSAIFAMRTGRMIAIKGIQYKNNAIFKCQSPFKEAIQCAKLSSQSRNKPKPSQNLVVASYLAALTTFILGVSYASVPLYKVFCSMTGFGGTTQRSDEKKAALIKPVPGGKVIKVVFSSNVHSTMCWNFYPSQREVKLIPGETALAFYTVSNPSNKAITGVATYNVFPPKAGLYFSKIQCFCFEEQRLGPKEEIDMPVFFYIDPEFANDPAMDAVNCITLSYTFFKTGEEDVEPDVVDEPAVVTEIAAPVVTEISAPIAQLSPA